MIVMNTILKVYNAKTIREVVQFGLQRGVRVVPEFDAPAHVGEGWQDTGLTVCFKVTHTHANTRMKTCLKLTYAFFHHSFIS